MATSSLEVIVNKKSSKSIASIFGLNKSQPIDVLHNKSIKDTLEPAVKTNASTDNMWKNISGKTHDIYKPFNPKPVEMPISTEDPLLNIERKIRSQPIMVDKNSLEYLVIKL